MSGSGYHPGHSPNGYQLGEYHAMDNRPQQQLRQSGSDDSTREDVEVVRVTPQKIAPVDERTENTLHRALNANQVYTRVLPF